LELELHNTIFVVLVVLVHSMSLDRIRQRIPFAPVYDVADYRLIFDVSIGIVSRISSGILMTDKIGKKHFEEVILGSVV